MSRKHKRELWEAVVTVLLVNGTTVEENLWDYDMSLEGGMFSRRSVIKGETFIKERFKGKLKSVGGYQIRNTLYPWHTIELVTMSDPEIKEESKDNEST